MGFALNILALLLVVGMCWLAMVWLSGRSHGSHGSDRLAQDPCAECEGVGATQDLGRLMLCSICDGTGMRSS